MIHSSSSRSWSKRLTWFTCMTLTIALVMIPIPPVYAQSVVRGIVTTSSEVTHEVVQRSRAFLKDGRFAQLLRSPQSNGQNRGMPAAPVNPPTTPHQRTPTKPEREARVSRLQIEPQGDQGDLQLGLNDPLMLVAVPLDADGNPIHGLVAEWESSDPYIVSMSTDGQGVARKLGRVQLTARAGHKQSTVFVTVVPRVPALITATDNPAENNAPRKSVKPSQEIRRPKPAGRAAGTRLFDHWENLNASPAPLADPEARSLYWASNNVGTPPGGVPRGANTPAAATNGTETPGSANFSFGLPVAFLSGRGLDVDLPAVYNGRIWNKSTTSLGKTRMTYDVDKGWPAPGFRIGFGKLEDNNGDGTLYTLTDPNGTRHQLVYQSSLSGYYSTDGTFIHLTFDQYLVPTAVFADGTQILYGAASGPAYYPVKVTDRNGNYILISYVYNIGPRISSIQDTMGRYVRFYYATNNDLVAVTTPAYNGGTPDRQTIRFYYTDVNVSQSNLFQSSIIRTGPVTAHVINYVYLPNATETGDAHIGFRYDYSAYGMIYQVTQFRGMTVSTTTDLTQTGYVQTEGTMAAQTLYNYPTAASSLSDAPTYTTRTDDWAGRVSAQPVYNFSVPSPGISIVTAPDGTVTETDSISDPGGMDDGLPTLTTVKLGSTLLASTTSTWAYGSNGLLRLSQVKMKNEAGQTKAAVFTYDAADLYNNIWKVSERDFTTDDSVSPTELRRTETIYKTDSQYLNRNLIHLPTSVKVFSPQLSRPISQADYVYDESARVSLTAPADIVMYTNPQTSARGDVTTVTQYADASNPGGPASPISHSTNYDSMGNVTLAAVDCCQQKIFTYSNTYQYSYPTAVTRGNGPTFTSSATYDFNTGLTLSSTDENNQVTNFYYNSSSLRPAYVQRADGSTTHFYYGDGLQGNSSTNGLHYFTNTSTQLDSSRMIDSYRWFDGRGAVTQTFDNYAYDSQLSSSNWSTQDIEYDVMGRAYRSSNPYYSGGYGWVQINPTGLWTTQTFDNLGRVTQVTAPSGDSQNPTTATAYNYFNGNQVLVKDQAGKERMSQTNALSQLTDVWEITAPDSATEAVSFPNHTEVTAGYHTVSAYDMLGDLLKVTQGAQNRYYKYDSLGRLTYERQVEQDAPWTFADAQPPLGTGNSQWSRNINYNSNGLVVDAYDARQLRTHFSYDGLNRVKQIDYYLQNGSPDPATPSAYYWYDSQTLPSGAPSFTPNNSNGRLIGMTYGGVTSSTGNYFSYNTMGRVVNHWQRTGSTNYAMVYAYNVGGLLTSETYPSLRVMNYAYDEGGRLSQVTDGASTVYDNLLTYAPQGALSSETFGNTAVHSMTYNNALQASQVKLSISGAEKQRYDYSYGQVNQADGSVDTTKNNGQIGRIDGTINGAGTKEWDQRFVYDSLGRLSTAAEYKQGNNSLLTWQAHYDYDRFGNRFQYQSNVNVGYIAVQSADIDAARNRLVSQWWAPLSYDPAGNLTSDGKFRGMNYQYDANSRMTQSSRTDGSGQSTTVYDCGGQHVQTTVGGVTRQMVYDVFGQLVGEYKQGSLDKEYLYRGGQLLAVNDVGGSQTNLALNKAPTQSSTFVNAGVTFSASRAVDGNTNGDFWGGNTTSSTNYEYQPWWQLDLGSSQQIDNIQVWPRTDCCPEMTSNFYVLVSDNPFTSTDLNTTLSQPGVSSYYVSGYGGAPATVNVNRTGRYVRVQKSDSQYLVLGEVQVWTSSGNGGLKYVLQDLHGSTRAVMSGSQIVARYDQMPFGEEISAGTGLRTTTQGYSVTQDVRHRYASTEKDDTTGLDHTWWRKYESFSGRWSSPDPLGGSIADPRSFNRYAYAGNDPVNFVDPSGLDWNSDNDAWFERMGFNAKFGELSAYYGLHGPPIDEVHFRIHTGVEGNSYDDVYWHINWGGPSVTHYWHPKPGSSGECRRFAAIVAELARKNGDSDSAKFMQALKDEFLDRSAPEWGSGGFKPQFKDDTPPNNSPNQVYHYVGTFEAGYLGASYLGYTLGREAGLSAANEHEMEYDIRYNAKGDRIMTPNDEKTNWPTHVADRALNEVSVTHGALLGSGGLKPSALANLIRRNVCQ